MKKQRDNASTNHNLNLKQIQAQPYEAMSNARYHTARAPPVPQPSTATRNTLSQLPQPPQDPDEEQVMYEPLNEDGGLYH